MGLSDRERKEPKIIGLRATIEIILGDRRIRDVHKLSNQPRQEIGSYGLNFEPLDLGDYEGIEEAVGMLLTMVARGKVSKGVHYPIEEESNASDKERGEGGDKGNEEEF